MSKTLKIQEYDTITSCVHYQGEKGYGYLEERHMQELERFILEFSGMSGDTDVLQFLKPGFRRKAGKVITVSNYVGVIQLQSGLSIEILPKVLMGEDDADFSQTKKAFLRMLRCLREFEGRSLNFAHLKPSTTNLYEIFISMFVREARELAKKGLKSSYLEEESNLSFYKGKLSVSEHIKRNFAHQERFFMRYDEYEVDRPENRLIKSTLLKLLKLTGSAEIQREIRQVITMFEMVKPSDNYQRDFAGVIIDRSTKQYELLIDWAKVFLMNKCFSIFSGSTTARALLFPMEKVFEAFVAAEMKKYLIPQGFRVNAQDHKYCLFDEPIKQFALRPDIVVIKDDGQEIIMDTKWKRLSPSKANYGISQADMYQMYAYAKKYSTKDYTPDVWILYPMSAETQKIQDLSFDSNDGVNVKVFFIDCADVECIERLCSNLLEDENRHPFSCS